MSREGGHDGYTASRWYACHWVRSKRDFDRKSSSTLSEGSFYVFFYACHPVLLDLWHEKDSSYRDNNFRCYSLLIQGSYDHVLPPPEAKGS
jgi:hypothetical protein